MQTLLVNGSVQGISLPMFGSAKMPVDVRWELSHSASPGQESLGLYLPVLFTRVDLSEDLLREFRERTPVKKEQGIQLFLEPGTYRLTPSPGVKAYMASARSGGTDLLEEDLVVAPGSDPAPVEIVMRDDVAQIRGIVANTGPLAEGRVVAVPERARRQAVSTGLAADGSFHFYNLPPGRYSVIAFQNAEGLDLENPSALERIRRMGESIELQPDANSTITLEFKRWEE
jgi:hypothetical protein